MFIEMAKSCIEGLQGSLRALRCEIQSPRTYAWLGTTSVLAVPSDTIFHMDGDFQTGASCKRRFATRCQTLLVISIHLTLAASC
mmetsp:Transcript_66088/g.158076  ORF Transcript_66088/g.158076 Transcript_66088/m.158076 type:complete len:84 (+) Transcript_66088:249-500(+)